MMNTVNTELSHVEVWFTNQNSKAIVIEDNVNLTLVIGYIVINNCRCRCYEIKDLLYDKIHLYFH